MIIQRKNCVIRSWTEGDETNLAHHANDRLIWNNMRDVFPHPYNGTNAAHWIAFANQQLPERNFAIDINDSAVGGIGFECLSDVHKYCAEIGFWLGRAFWCKGIMTEAVKLATRYAFQRIDICRVFAVVFESNVASQQVLKNCGYDNEGILHSSVVKNGMISNALVFANISTVNIDRLATGCDHMLD